MKVHVFVQPRARVDLLEQFIYLAEQGSLAVAKRYEAAVQKTFKRLQNHPYLGAVYHSATPRLEGMRHMPVSGFRTYQIFYLPQEDGISIIRVLHGARDIEAIIAEEES